MYIRALEVRNRKVERWPSGELALYCIWPPAQEVTAENSEVHLLGEQRLLCRVHKESVQIICGEIQGWQTLILASIWEADAVVSLSL